MQATRPPFLRRGARPGGGDARARAPAGKPLPPSRPRGGVRRPPSPRRPTAVRPPSAAPTTAASASTAPPGVTPPPPPPPVPVAPMVALPIPGAPPDVLCLRGSTPARLKVEVEYGLKRGTTDNCYLLGVGGTAPLALIDVPDAAWAGTFVPLVQAQCASGSPSPWPGTLVLTHLTPKRWPSLRALLAARAGVEGDDGAPRPGTPPPPPLDLHLSNPALALLRESLDTDPAGTALATGLTLRVARAGGDPASRIAGPGGRLSLVPAPTPRWPDLLVALEPRSRLAFTSKLFSAHVDPGVALAALSSDGGSGTAGATITTAGDAPGGWPAYSGDWRHYFDCLLAPVSASASAALARLDLAPAPPVVEVPDALAGGGDKTSSSSSSWAFLRSIDTALAAAQRARWGETAIGSAAPPWTGEDGGTPIGVLCPLHGPTVQAGLTQLVRSYSTWIGEAEAAAATASVAVLYASAYGNTAALAQAVARGITKAGLGAEAVNLEVTPLKEVEEVVARSAGFAVGAPTLGGHMPTQVATALGAIIRAPGAATRLPAGVFGSFGWSGEAVDEMEGRLKDAGFRFAFPPLRVKFRPTGADMQAAEESGTDLAQAVLKARRKAQAGAVAAVAAEAAVEGGRAAATSPATAALGRVVGSLCVVTARDGDASTAMLASWISQASFNPPGLTVAVKRDRAAEPFLTKGAAFVVNVLAAGEEKALVRTMTKPFGPGEDRFAGIDGITPCDAAAGAPILPGIASYLVCTVADRMDAGDHYIVYATVGSGQVVDAAAESAVHMRKSGATY